MPAFIDTLRNAFCYDLAIDLGSTNTLIFRKGSGIVLDEPSAIAFSGNEHGRREVIGVGAEAKELAGGEGIELVNPVRHGSVSDFGAAREMLCRYLDRTKRKWLPSSLRVVANVPAEATCREKETIRALIRSAGAREAYLIEEPRALALGAGMEISDENGNMIVDIGGGITEMAVIAAGKVTAARTVRTGGEQMDLAIADYIRQKHGVYIDSRIAEKIKMQIGEAFPGTEKTSIAIQGRDKAGKDRIITVSSYEVSDAISNQVSAIIEAIKRFLSELSPELYVDILDRGILLAGGCSLLRNVDRLLERTVLMPFVTAQNPLTCLVQGSGDALNYIRHFPREQDK